MGTTPIAQPASQTAASTQSSRGGLAAALRGSAWLKKLRAKYVFVRSRSSAKITGTGNRFVYDDALLFGCSVEISGAGNTLEIDPRVRAWGVSLRLSGNNLTCKIGADCRLHGGHYILEDTGSRLFLGARSLLFTPMCVVNEGGAIFIGSDCMVANGTDLRNSDGHSILDLTTRERINRARDVTLADRVWIGAQCQILKGVTIGSGAIVAARSVVTKSVAANTLVGGVPARVIRENVDWDGRRL